MYKNERSFSSNNQITDSFVNYSDFQIILTKGTFNNRDLPTHEYNNGENKFDNKFNVVLP